MKDTSYLNMMVREQNLNPERIFIQTVKKHKHLEVAKQNNEWKYKERSEMVNES